MTTPISPSKPFQAEISPILYWGPRLDVGYDTLELPAYSIDGLRYKAGAMAGVQLWNRLLLFAAPGYEWMSPIEIDSPLSTTIKRFGWDASLLGGVRLFSLGDWHSDLMVLASHSWGNFEHTGRSGLYPIDGRSVTLTDYQLIDWGIEKSLRREGEDFIFVVTTGYRQGGGKVTLIDPEEPTLQYGLDDPTHKLWYAAFSVFPRPKPKIEPIPKTILEPEREPIPEPELETELEESEEPTSPVISRPPEAETPSSTSTHRHIDTSETPPPAPVPQPKSALEHPSIKNKTFWTGKTSEWKIDWPTLTFTGSFGGYWVVPDQEKGLKLATGEATGRLKKIPYVLDARYTRPNQLMIVGQSRPIVAQVPLFGEVEVPPMMMEDKVKNTIQIKSDGTIVVTSTHVPGYKPKKPDHIGLLENWIEMTLVPVEGYSPQVYKVTFKVRGKIDPNTGPILVQTGLALAQRFAPSNPEIQTQAFAEMERSFKEIFVGIGKELLKDM